MYKGLKLDLRAALECSLEYIPEQLFGLLCSYGTASVHCTYSNVRKVDVDYCKVRDGKQKLMLWRSSIFRVGLQPHSCMITSPHPDSQATIVDAAPDA